jgi:hypothetical protein
MSEMLSYIQTRKYIVTVYDYDDLDAIYEELETSGKAPSDTEIHRDVQCLERRPMSRNTVYRLTDWEAAQLKNDTRVKAVTIHPDELGIKAGTNATTQTSSAWDKSSGTSSSMKNWGLLRCTEGAQRTGWGGTGYQGNGSGTAAQTGTIELTQTGRNVDVVICDTGLPTQAHPEFAVNADGTGGSRVVNYNWFQHNPEVTGGAVGTYNLGLIDPHGMHVAGTVAGNTQGWARDSTIYSLYYDTGNTGNFSLVFDYVRAFHRNKTVNTATGRKNPTIVNNSWGMSVFPSEWSFSDITAVTYRGTRYTPGGATTFLGTSGVCTSSTRLANLAGLENFGNRITTSGPVGATGGVINTKPASWTLESNQSAYLLGIAPPDSTYSITLTTTGNNTSIRVKNDVASGGQTGQTSLSMGIQIVRQSDNSVITSFSQGPFVSIEGGDVSAVIDEDVILPTTGTYTITYTTALDISQVSNPLTAFAMLCTITQTPSGNESATVSSITNSLLGAASLTSSTTPTVGSNDDGYWTLALPFPITYLGTTHTTLYPSTNFYLTFGGGSTVWSGVSINNPALPKIMWCAKDNSVQRIYYGTEGVSPNRTFRVRQEGTSTTSGSVGSPSMVCEWTFYENAPSQIDLQVGVNSAKTTGGGFTTQQLNDWGFISGQRIPLRVSACDDDIEDLYDEGIIMVGAAGNGRWKHDAPGGVDWDNTFEMATRYPASVLQPYYTHRGTSPTANDTLTYGTHDLPAICVGSVDTIQIDQKVLYSDCGAGVDLFAPGTYIVSALPSGTADPRNSSYYIGKYSGTSMASPQVCGVLACALEVYPDMNQERAKAYITSIAKTGQLVATSGGPTDGQDLQGAPNLYLYYKKERETSGNVFPKINYKPRPSTGSVYPRPRIKRTL